MPATDGPTHLRFILDVLPVLASYAVVHIMVGERQPRKLKQTEAN